MTFAIGTPLVLLVWAAILNERPIVRLLTIYWKIASLLGISFLLLTDHRIIGYITLFLAPILMVISIWFWVDLNEELEDLPSLRALPLTIKIWRWSLTFYGLISTFIGINSVKCFSTLSNGSCNYWLELPNAIHKSTQIIFGFLFGANWTQSLAAFLGYILLACYLISLTQWILIKLPKNGRIAGGF